MTDSQQSPLDRIEPPTEIGGHLPAYLAAFAETRHLYVAGDIALSVAGWSMRGTARQGHPLDLSGVAADVLHR